MTDLSKDELLRYSRQLMVQAFGPEGQRKLQQASVFIVGAGGLGSAIAVQLTAMGVGALTIADPDTIELTNLHRQTAYTSADVGRSKVDALRQRLVDINPHVAITVHQHAVTADSAHELIGSLGGSGNSDNRPDIVIDGSDNFACRFAVNAYCVDQCIPLVSGAAIRQSGQLISFANQNNDEPCYHCLFAEQAAQSDTCSSAGVMPPVVSVIAAAQAMAAVQLLSGQPCPSLHTLHRFDLSTMAWRQSRAIQDPNCPYCGATAVQRCSHKGTPMRTLTLPRTILTMIMTDAQDRGAGVHGSMMGDAIQMDTDNNGPWQLTKDWQKTAALVYVVLEGTDTDDSLLGDMADAPYKMQALLGTKGVLQLHVWNCTGDTPEEVHLKI